MTIDQLTWSDGDGVAADRSSSSGSATSRTNAWWQTRWFMLAVAFAAAVPLLWPSIPPLIDLPGHMAGYRILAEAGRPPLSNHYAVHWALIGNLGVELPVLALQPLLGLEPAVKLVVTAIPVITVLAMLWAAREAHGHIPAAAPFALPLAYALPFQYGFVNFSLAVALAFAGLGLWLYFARTQAPWVRVVVAVPVAAAIWVCHVAGWAQLGVFIFGAETVLQRRGGRSWPSAAVVAGLMCAPMAAPVALKIALFGNQLSGPSGDWFRWWQKLIWIVSLFREYWRDYDLACTVAIGFILVLAVRSPRLSYNPVLGIPALLTGLAFILLPRFAGGGSYVDMRMLPATVALGILAIRVAPGEPVAARRLATAATAFFALRMTTSTIAFVLLARGQTEALKPINLFPVGAAVLVLVPEPTIGDWQTPRLDHIDGIAIERRRVFTNGQWSLPGQQLVTPRHPEAAPFDRDPSQLVDPGQTHLPFDANIALARFDRALFSYVWTVDMPLGSVDAHGLRPIWSDGRSVVYRVVGGAQKR